MHPALYVFGSFHNVFFTIVSRSSTISLHLLGAISHEQLVLCIQKIRCLKVPRHQKDATRCPGDCDDPFYDIEPGEVWYSVLNRKIAGSFLEGAGGTDHRHPGISATPFMLSIAQASKPPNAPERADATAKFVRHPHSLTHVIVLVSGLQLTEEERDADRQLLTLVPVAEEQGHGGEQASLEEPQQYAAHHEGAERVDEPRAEAYDPPAEGDGGYDPVELEPLDQDGGGEFREDVEDVEYRYRGLPLRQ